MRRLRRLGLCDLRDLIAIAVQRGCTHYRSAADGSDANDPGRDVLADEELAVALLTGEHPFDPVALRCAAQLVSGAGIDSHRLSFLARRERCERALAHIARAGMAHDEKDREFWKALLDSLRSPQPVPPGVLPHWTRFAVLTGVQSGGRREIKSVWLRARR
ncbi:MAG TPA: hypothetical protein VIK52_05525 [Opitutaceae bacterium]